MQLRDSMYHSILRTSALTLALVLLFVSGILSPVTKELADHTGAYLAQSVGMSAGVEPTELNTLTAELTEQKQALAEREAALREREIAVDVAGGGSTSAGGGQITTYILSVILFIMLVLIILNYGLDFARQQRRASSATTQSAS